MAGNPFKQEAKEIAEFLKLLTTTVSGGFSIIAAAVPLTGFVWQGLAPPWPSTGSPVIPAACSVLTIIALFLRFRRCEVPSINRASTILLASGVGLTVVYLFCAGVFLDEVGDRVHLTGFTLTKEAVAAVNKPAGPKEVAKDLLDWFGHDSEDRIWTGRGVLKASFLIVCSLSASACAGGLSLLLVAGIVERRAGEGATGAKKGK